MHRKYTSLIIFVFFLLISVCVILLQNVWPIRGLIGWSEKSAQSLQLSTFTSLTDASGKPTAEQTTQLKVIDLQNQIDHLTNDNLALKDQFSIDTIPTRNLLPADIIGMPRFIPGISQPETIIVDKGTNQGVRVGMVVVVKDLLVGLVSSVKPEVSEINLVSNANMSFTGRTLKTNAMGIIQGQGGGKILLGNVVVSDALQLNDIVVTKGDVDQNGNGVPPQLVVGTITNVYKDPSALFQSAVIKQAFDITRLTTVFLYINQ